MNKYSIVCETSQGVLSWMSEGKNFLDACMRLKFSDEAFGKNFNMINMLYDGKYRVKEGD